MLPSNDSYSLPHCLQELCERKDFVFAQSVLCWFSVVLPPHLQVLAIEMIGTSGQNEGYSEC